jgi:hypothetical protein
MRPIAATTWGKIGQTPVIKTRGRWKNVTAVGMLVISPRPRRRIRQLFRLYDHSIDKTTCAEYVRWLLRQVRGPVDIVWDRLPAHKSADVQRVLERHPRARVHLLPKYAPELNPVEQMWCNGKAARLRGVAADDEIDLALDAEITLEDIGSDQNLLRSFVRNTPLRIPGISS